MTDYEFKMLFGTILFLILIFLLGLNIGQTTSDNLNNKLKLDNEMLKRENQFLRETVELMSSQKDLNYMYGEATAYTPTEMGINSDSDPTRTSTMSEAKNGVIAVNPKVIPYGSEIMIIHNGTVIRGRAEDTGGAMRKNPRQVDILMENIADAKNWGRKKCHILWW